MFSAYNYLVYRFRATNEHGVHSPFVFDLLLSVIYNEHKYYSYEQCEQLRGRMLLSSETLSCIDLGAGSAYGTTIKRKVSQIARNSAKPPKFAQLLFRLVNHFQPESLLELGTSLGLSTAYMASAKKDCRITTMEGCPEIAAVALANFRELDLNNIELRTGNFDDLLPKFLSDQQVLPFVFFDGNHRKEATLSYFSQCLEKADAGSVFVFDDIYWSPEMKEAWELIKSHPKVTVTIDLFHLGIVFFRKEQAKQHFIIRF
jgi:predicted O-methyltransferase YrrM